MVQYADSRAITRDEITSSLQPLNGGFFHIDDLGGYADKLVSLGKCVALRHPETDVLLSYILYYDNGPEVFISMVWTNPDYRGKGLAGILIDRLSQSSKKDILLEVNPENPAIKLYETRKFRFETMKGDNHIMRLPQRLSVMQPYIFPYIGYFHLIEASSEIIFYDDVNYIKGGWINRNRIFLEGKDLMVTVPLKDASSFKTIADTMTGYNDKFRDKLAKQLFAAYAKAPFYGPVSKLVLSVFDRGNGSIADLAIDSIVAVYDYLGLPIRYSKSSEQWASSKGMDKADRLIYMTRQSGYSNYINPVGGSELYDKAYFEKNGVKLSFVRPENISYRQFDYTFVPWLSIIDVLMFNDIKRVREMFTQYEVS